MPKKLGEILNNLFTKAGIKADDPALVAIVQNGEIFKMDVPDEMATTIEASLHTLDSAKSKLKSTIVAEAYNGLDAELVRLMDEEKLDDATKAELKAEVSSTKRAVALTKKIKELTAKANKADPGDKKDLIEKINALNEEKSALTKTHEAELQRIRNEHQSQLDDVELTSSLSNYNYGLGEIDPSVKVLTAKNILTSAMQKDGVKVMRGKSGKLELVNADGSEYFNPKNNLKIDLKSYTESAISGILKASDDPGTGGNKPTTVTPGTPTLAPGDQNFLNNLTSQLAGEVKVKG